MGNVMKYPGTDLQTYNLDWVIMEVKRIAKANGIEFNDDFIHIGADNVQEAIVALYNLIMEISSQTNAVEVIDSSILETTWATGYTYTHLQTVNTPTLMAIVNAMRLSKSIILRRDVATNDEAAFVLLEVTYDPILFKHELKFVNPYIHKVATLNIFGLDDDANVYAEILPDVTVKYVNTFNGRSGNVLPASSDYDADQVDYSNTSSELASTNVQDAIDEVNNNIPHTANLIGYNNTSSGLQATDVQAAIDEVDDKIPANIVETFNGRTGAVTPAAHDYDADQVDYDNTTSGLSATDVQTAIDELVANPPAPVAADIDYSNTTSGLQATNVQDALDEIANDVLSSGVASFNGRTGAVNPAAHDYDADQIDYDNTTSGLSATDTQSAIDELAVAIPADVLGDLETETGNPLSITTDSEQIARSTKITLLPIQASGTPTPSNPIPISGYDSVVLQACGVNQWDEEWEIGRYNYDDGTKSDSINQIRNKRPIVVKSSTTYFFKGPDVGVVLYYGEDGSYISYASVNNNTFTTPANCKYLCFYMSSGYGTTYNNDISINYPSTDTSYHAYEGKNISHTLPETVYGGELDVETGVLKVTHEIIDLGSLDYTKYDTAEGTLFRSSIISNSNITPDMGYPAGPALFHCSAYNPVRGDNRADLTISCGVNNRIDIIDDDYSDAAVFKTAVTGQKLVYELATPSEIQLTPHEVDLLRGANMITTNGTSIALVYREGEIAALSDVKAVNDFLKAGLDSLDAETVKQTSGELDAKLNANQTAAAVLSNLMLRDIKIQTTAVTPGDDATEPDGTVIIVYEP